MKRDEKVDPRPGGPGAARDASFLHHGAGRRGECEALERLLDAARAGSSSIVVLRGEAGSGKTALLDVLSERASDFRIARVLGVESEMELAFAGLHQLCAPMLDRVEHLPAPQRDALRVAFGLSPTDHNDGICPFLWLTHRWASCPGIPPG